MNGLKRNLKGLLFVSPWLVGFIVFGLYPMVMSISLAFTNYSILQPGRTQFTGLANITRLISDSLFWKALGNTGFMAVIGVPASVIIALAVALPLNFDMRGVNIYRALIYLPALVPPMVVVLLFLWILNPNYGLLKIPFDLLQIPSPGWMADPAWSKPAIMLMVLWNTVGQVMVITLAGLRDIPKHLYEAAAIDGAGRWDQFYYITLPGLSPVIFYNVLTGAIFFLQIFTQAYASALGVSGGGGTSGSIGAPINSTLMISLHIYKMAFISSQAGYASLISVVVLIISVALALVFFRFAGRYVHYEYEGEQP